MERTGVPIVSLTDSSANVAAAARSTDVAQVAVCAPSNLGLNIIDVDLVQRMGRRRVLRLPDRRQTMAWVGASSRAVAPTPSHPT